jgi:hypothetical protein
MPFYFISQALLSAMATAVYAFVVLLVVVLAIQQTANSVRIARLKRKHGCQPVNRIPQPERIIGWHFFKIQLSATKNKNVLETGKRRYQEYGQTWSVSMMGQTFYNVCIRSFKYKFHSRDDWNSKLPLGCLLYLFLATLSFLDGL